MTLAIANKTQLDDAKSFLASLAVHGTVIGSMILIFQLNPTAPPQDEYLDLGYQVFDAPPPPTEQVVRARPTPQETTPVANPVKDTAARELQDKDSTISGSQKKSEESSQASTQDSGSATATPYYKIKPKYPRTALLEGKEGWVKFQIDIKTTGEVDNIRLVDGVLTNLFASEARRALSQWKYKPFTGSDGQPTEKKDYLVQVDFKLADVTN